MLRRIFRHMRGADSPITCHTPNNHPTGSHSLHGMNSCISCHMAKIVKNAESGDLHDDTMKVIQPKVSLEHGGLENQANSCSYCHYHKDRDPAELQRALDAAKRPLATRAKAGGSNG